MSLCVGMVHECSFQTMEMLELQTTVNPQVDVHEYNLFLLQPLLTNDTASPTYCIVC